MTNLNILKESNNLDIELLIGLNNRTADIRLRGMILFCTQITTAFFVSSLVVKIIIIMAILSLYKVLKTVVLNDFPNTNNTFENDYDEEYVIRSAHDSLRKSIDEKLKYNPEMLKYTRLSVYIYLAALVVSLFLT